MELLRRLDVAQAETGRGEPLRTYVRAAAEDAAEAGRYAEAGVSELVLWAHELCPPGPGRWERPGAEATRLGMTDDAFA